MSASSLSNDSATQVSLHDLYAEYDAIWQEMLDENDRYHRWRRDNGITGPIEIGEKGKEIRERLAAVRSKIQPLERDFEPVLIEALGERIKADRDFAVAVYASLCNVDWQHEDGSRWSISWRGAGGLIAEIRDQDECYLDFYCSGNEGYVDELVAEAVAQQGWTARA